MTLYTNKNDENYFDPTPKLKTSPVPISFIPFNNEKHKCNDCGNTYSVTFKYKQKYCKKCFLSYVKNLTDNDTYLDVYINTNNTQCIEHETTRSADFCTNNIREWCENCSEISYFKNYYDYNDVNTTNKYIFMAEDCGLCGKKVYQISSEFKMCSDCYIISSGWMESTLTKKPIPILYLPWWDASNKSRICNHNLKFISDCQKWCSYCFIIYTGCKYCLTTNIILGITDRSQCKKCREILNINIEEIRKSITKITSGDRDIDDFLISTRTNIDGHNQIVDYVKNIDKNSNPLNIYGFIENKLKNIHSKRIMEWIPYSQITMLEKIASGGFGVIYKATWYKTDVAVKRFKDSKYLLNELEPLHRCYDMTFIIKYYGITQDPETKDYMLIMEYASGGNLHNYLSKYFTNIKWNTKLAILSQISDGLKTIHNENFIHRDFHSGNVLSLKNKYKLYNKWVIGDLGLSQPADNPLNDEIYGVIPYIAPEIFEGAGFSKQSDIYSLGMIMWEFTTGCKPFANVDHDLDLIIEIIDGSRPEITKDTPECFAELMKRCWDDDPSKRPSITEIKTTFDDWYRNGSEIFNQAEKTRLKLIQLKMLGPKFTKKSCLGAIYAGRSLTSLISKFSKSSPISQSSPIPQYSQSSPTPSFTTQSSIATQSSITSQSTSQSSIISQSSIASQPSDGYISKEIDFDIP